MTLLATVLVSSIVVSLAYLAVVTAAAAVAALRIGGRREDPIDNHDALSESRFTIPVSLILTMGEDSTDSVAASQAIAALLGLNYPELEVIVVAEGLPAAIWASLKAEWELEAREFFYRQSLATGPVRMIYRSSRDSRLMVADKAPDSSRADAVNCGVNLARFKYVSALDADVVFDANALLRAMAAPLRDPASIVGASSHVEARDRNLLQRLASIRSLMESRTAARRAAIAPAGGVVVWRRDAIVQLGGFSTTAADSDLDMTVRVKTSSQVGWQVARSAEIFGHLDAHSAAARVRLTERRQLAALEAVRSLVSDGSDTAGTTMRYLFTSEVLTPFVRAWVVAASVSGAAAGWISWMDVVFVVLLLSLGQAIVSAAALLLRGSAPGAPDDVTLRRLLLLAPFEFVLLGPAAAYARGRSLWSFVNRS